jgi:poly(3-hydroxybutyrate) depolymerase
MKLTFYVLMIITMLFYSACSKSNVNPDNAATITTTNTAVKGTRYQDSLFTAYIINNNISFGKNNTIGGVSTTLLLDFYQPAADTAKFRPLVIIVFGGGFTMGDKTTLSALAKRLVYRGYAAACTSYRLYDGASPMSNANLKTELLMGMQDIAATVRFFKKDAANGNTYKIDTNKIFVLGHSAGAMIALHTTYVNSTAKLTSLDPAFLSIVNANGGLTGSSGNAGYSSKIRGIINLAGALIDKNYITQSDVPLMSVYGTNDTLMPYNDGIFSLPSITGIAVSGSVSLQTRANAVNLSNSLYAIAGGDHFAPTTDNTAFTKMVAFLYSNL